MKMQNRAALILLFVMIFFDTLSISSAQQLLIKDGSREMVLQARILEGEKYYRVEELGAALGFRFNESGINLELVGDRGSLSLISSRPLVRSGEQYILLSAPVVKLRSGGWWVPEDILEKALPNILSHRLVSSGENTYRIESLDRNLVSVNTVDYPDHVSVVFRTSKQVAPRIREFREFVEVRFEQYVVSLDSIQNPSTFDVVASVSFDPNDGLGTFRVNKGKNYGGYKQYLLTNPPRLVIDFLEARGSVETITETPVPSPEEAPTVREPTGRSEESRLLEEETASREEVVVIDPGHGGPDPGVQRGSAVMEKNLTLAVALLIQDKLEEKGIKTRLTRDRDSYLTPDQRSSVANFYRTRAFVSLHLGASTSPETQGPVVYLHRPFVEKQGSGDALEVQSEEREEKVDGPNALNTGESFLTPWEEGQLSFLERSRGLAQILQRSLNEVFLAENRVQEIPLYLLEPVRGPAVLVEFGFLTNSLDREFLLSDSYQREIAQRIADGIAEFLR